MESSWPEKLPINRKQIVEELTQGCESATQLQSMLGSLHSMKANGGVLMACADSLVTKILDSFTETISMLNSSNSDDFSRVNLVAAVSSPASWDGRKSEDSGESIKTAAPKKNRRGCYKRRNSSESITKHMETLVDDGYAWRKYGQKGILNCKYQRNYYRCTHKYDQGCKATKQVQKIKDEPPLHEVIYSGHHTCNNLHKAPQIIFDPPTSKDSSILLSFESKGLIEKKPIDTYLPSVKHGYKEDSHGANYLGWNQMPCNSDYYVSTSNLTTLVSSASMPSRSDHGDVISSGVYSRSSCNYSFGDIMAGNTDDFDDFQFEIFS